MMKERFKGKFVSHKRFKKEDLLKAILNYNCQPAKSGKNNPNFKDGKGEEYIRIRVNGIKVKRSHIVWMLINNKDHIPKEIDIHHKNENKRDDRPCNLVAEEHSSHGIRNLIQNRKIKNGN